VPHGSYIKNGVIEEALVETIGCSGMTHSPATAGGVPPGAGRAAEKPCRGTVLSA